MLDLSFSSNGHSSDAHKRIMSQFICTKKVVSCINTSSVLALVQCECHAGKKMLLQEINQFNRNWDADFRFSTNFWFLVQLPGGECPFRLSCESHESIPPYLSKKNKCPWKNFKWSGNTSSQ